MDDRGLNRISGGLCLSIGPNRADETEANLHPMEHQPAKTTHVLSLIHSICLFDNHDGRRLIQHSGSWVYLYIHRPCNCDQLPPGR